jgi:hypothetical protein
MNKVAEMGSGDMILVYTIQKLIAADTQTHRQHGGPIGLLLFFETKATRLKIFNTTCFSFKL